MRHSHRSPRHGAPKSLRCACGGPRPARLAVVAVWLAVSGAPFAHAADSGQVQQQLSTTRQKVTSLAGDVAAAKGRVNQLSAGIASLSSRLAEVQGDLSAKRTDLLRLRARLTSAQARLTRLERIVAADQRVLAAELVGGYEGARPDIVDVVLEATGFNDLLERLSFAQRIGRQDARIAGNVKAARQAVSAQAIRLGTLSARQDQLAEQALTERNQVATLRVRLVSQRLAAAQTAVFEGRAVGGRPVRGRLAHPPTGPPAVDAPRWCPTGRAGIRGRPQRAGQPRVTRVRVPHAQGRRLPAGHLVTG